MTDSTEIIRSTEVLQAVPEDSVIVCDALSTLTSSVELSASDSTFVLHKGDSNADDIQTSSTEDLARGDQLLRELVESHAADLKDAELDLGSELLQARANINNSLNELARTNMSGIMSSELDSISLVTVENIESHPTSRQDDFTTSYDDEFHEISMEV